MSTSPSNSQLPQWPRGLSRQQAAAYVGLGATFFDQHVLRGIFPEPANFGRRKLWDKAQLDAAMDRIFNGRSTESDFELQ